MKRLIDFLYSLFVTCLDDFYIIDTVDFVCFVQKWQTCKLTPIHEGWRKKPCLVARIGRKCIWHMKPARLAVTLMVMYFNKKKYSSIYNDGLNNLQTKNNISFYCSSYQIVIHTGLFSQKISRKEVSKC